MRYRFQRFLGRCKWAAVRLAARINWALNRRIPQPGDIVITGLDGFGCKLAMGRVTGWLCDYAPFKPDLNDPTECMIAGIIENDEGYQKPRRDWCYPEFAEYVSAAGVCGYTVPLKHCLVVGRVKWPKEHIDESADLALRLATFRNEI